MRTLTAIFFVTCQTVFSAAFAASSLPTQAGRSYVEAKKDMLANGWKIDIEWRKDGPHSKPAYEAFPEILCGSGYQAVCTSRFIKGQAAVLLTIDQNSRAMLVTAVDKD